MFKMDMCNCLKKFKTQFSLLKKLTGILIFLFVSASLWATDYYWIGGDNTSATWADGDKWSLAEGGTSAAAYPGNTDTAIIDDEVTFTDTDVSCGAINSSKALSFSGNLTLTSASTIDGGLNIGGALTLSGGLTLSSGNLSVTGGDTTNNNAGTILISSGNCTLKKYISYDSTPSSVPFNTIDCSGELRANGGEFRGDISAGSITISGDASLLGATHTIRSTGNQYYGGVILVNSSSGSLELIGSTITFNKNIQSWGADQKALIITGNAVFNATAGATIPLKSLSVSGTTIISGSSIATNEGQTYSGEVEIRSSTSLTSTSNKSITFNDVLTIDNGKTLSLNGRPAISSLLMDGSSLALSNSADLTISNLTLTSTVGGASNNTLTAGSGSITVSNATYYLNNLTTSGNVSLAAGIIGTLTADGITTLAGGSISSLAVTGSNLNLTGDLEVTTLSLSGTSTTNLELSGSGKSIILASNQTSGSYLKIASDIYIKSSASAAADGVTGRYYQADNSIPSAGTSDNYYATVIKNGWRIKSLSLMDYTWTGSTSTDWADGSNWGLGITPGSGDTAGVDVTIPAGASNYPIISDDNYTLKDLTIEIAAELSVNGKNLQAESLDCGGSINLSSAELEITDSITAFAELDLNDSTFTNSTGNSVSINTLTLGSNESTLNAGTSSISVSNDISGGRLKTYGNISTAALSLSSLNVSSGPLIAGGDIEISGSSPSLTVNGSLKMDSGSYSLTLTGSSASDLLSVSGSGTISLYSSQITGDYIKLEGSLSIANSKIYTAIHSQNNQSNANPYNGWNILSGDLVYIWDGSASTSPDLAENWVTDIVPVTTDDILIPALTGTSPNYPILTAAAVYNKVTVDTDAKLDLASFNLTASKITNNGLVRLAGSQSVSATEITNDPDSTVEYYGTLSDGNLPMKGTSTSFGKLLFSDGANGTVSDAISVADTTEIYCGSSNSLSLTGANTFTGLLTAGNSSTSVNAGTLTLNAASAFTLDSNALAESLTIQSAVNLSGNVTTSGGQTYHGGVTTGSQDITLLSGTDTVSFLSTLTGSGNDLSVGNTTTASNARFSDVVSGFSALSVAGTTLINTASITTTGGQTYTGDVSVTSNTSLTSSTQDDINFIKKLTVSNEKTLSLNGNTSINNAILSGSTLNNNSTGSAISITNLTLGNNESTLNAGTSSISVGSAISGGRLATSGTISTAAMNLNSLKISSGTLTASGNVDISGASSSLVVDGTLDMDSGSYELTLTGSSDTDLLSVSGSGTIKLASSQITGDYIKLEGSLSIANSKIYTAIHSQNNQSNANPYNGWNILSGDLIYIWDGSASTSPTLAENWLTDLVPGTTDDILIPSLPGASPNYPLLTAAAEYKEVTIDADAQMDFSTYNFTASKITNKGLVRLAGSQTVTATTITNDSDSTVEYYGTLSAGTLPMKGTSTSFGKLLFSDGANGTISDAISVANTTEIYCGSSNALSLTGANTFTGLLTAGNSSTSVNAGTLTLNAASAFTLASNALAESLTIQSAVNLSGNVTTSGGQTYHGDVSTGSQDITLLSGTDTVSFLSTLTGSGNALSVGNSTTASNARFSDTVSGFSALSVEGTTQINTTSITTTGEQTYTGGVSTGSQNLALLAGTDTVSFLSTLTGSGNTLSVGNTTNVSKARFSNTVSGFSTLSVAGTTQIDTNSITTSGGQTYTGAVSTGSQNLTLLSGTDTISFLSTLTGSGNTLSVGNATSTSNVIFTGTVSSLASLSVEGTTQINTTSITTTGGQTYSGNVSVTQNSSLTSTTTDAINFSNQLTVASGKTLSLSGTTNINTALLNGSTIRNTSPSGTLSITTLNLGSNESSLDAGSSSIAVANNITSGKLKTYGNVSTVALTLSSLNVSSGTLTAGGDIEISGSSPSLTVIGNLKMDSGEHELKLTGSSGDLLKVSGSGTISLYSSQITGNYISLEGSLSIANSKIYTATHSQNNQSTANPYNGWNILSGDLIFMWDGSTSTSVLDAENWITDLVPTATDDILIPSLPGANPNYPLLTADAEYNEVTISADAQMDFSTYNFTASKITNKGLVRLAGSQIVTSTTIINDEDSTVEYYGTLSGGNLPMKGTSTSFGKLLFSDGANGTISDVISVAGTTDILCGTGNILSLTGANTFSGLVKVGDSTTPKNGGEITINSAAGFTLDSNALADSLSVSSSVVLNGNVKTVGGGQTYTGAVSTGSQDLSLLAETNTVSFLSTLTGSANNVSIGNSTTTTNAIFTDVVSNLDTLSVAGTTQINAASITTTGGQTYTSAVSTSSQALALLAGTDTVTFLSTFTGSANALTIGNASTPSNAIFSDTVSNLATLTVTGTTQIDAASITTTGGQTYHGEVTTGPQNITLLSGTDTISFLSTLTGSGNSLSVGNSTTASNVTFSDVVTDFSTLSVAGTTQIDTTSITTTRGQTYKGAVSTGTQDLTLLAGTDTITFLSTLTGSANNLTIGNSTTPSNVTFSAPVSNLTNLLVTGATQIDTNSITTTGGQTYTGNVTTTSTNTTLLATDDDSIINFKADLLAATNNLTINCGTHLTSGTSATITAGNIQIIGNYENTGSITSNAASTSVTKNIVNTGSADFTNGISLAGNFTDTIGDWTGSITLNGTDAQNFNPNTTTTYSNVFINKTNGITNFTDTVTITTLTDSTTYTADINFYKNINILTDTSLNTSGKIIFASQADSITSFTSTFGSSSNYKDFTHTAGQTILDGNLIADEITLAESNLKGITNINCTNLTLQNDLTCTLETYYLKLTGNLTTSGTHNFYPNVMIDGSFIGGGSSIFKKNLYFFKDSSTASTASINSLTVDGDLIISAERAFNTSGTIRTKKNFVLYRGQISAAASSVIQADLDIILLGQFYSLNDASRSSNPSNTDYIYQQTRTNGSCNYTRTDFSAHNDQMPDGTYLPDSTDGFTGLYTGASGSILHAGKNWYANGLKDSDTNPTLGLTASSQWYIDIPDLTDTQNQTGFAETYNSYADHNTVRCHTPPAGTTAPDANGIYSRMPAYNCSYQADSNGDALTNVNWLFTDLLITQAYTERDNSIYIEFNRAVRNSNNELKNAISRFTNSSVTYQGFYTDPDCTSALPDNTNRSEDSANKVWLYLKTADSTSWNTDATGTSAGNSASTNRYGIHQNVIPYIKVSENNSYPITDIWGKRLAYYDGTSPFENVTDHTGPVLYSVRTGQEFHSPYNSSTGESSQPSYDSHNFLEFRYSEAVNFGSTTAGTSTPLQNVFDNSDITTAIWLPAAASTSADNTVNIRVRDSFGALTNSITQSGNLTLAGLATIENGKLHTASQGVDNKYVNALYRQDAFSIRLSLAGYTEGTATDQHNNIYKKWTGYIESAIQPSGLVSLVADTNNLITDCALDSDGVTPLYNPQIRYADDATITPSVNIIYSNGNQYDNSGIYGNWDLSEPVFATLRLDSTSDWAESQYFEAVGTNSGSGSTLDKIEFHIFDNTPAYSSSDPAIWLSEKGWVTNTAGSTTLYDASYSYCADITGGSKQFDSDSSQRSSGGIRYSTLETSSSGFKYSSGQGSSVVPSTNFVSGINGIYTGAKASLFVGSSTTRRSPTDPDGLYFGLGLSDTNFPVTQSFTVSYDEDSAYITDLAGNRLRSKTIRTIDRTPPSFDITLSPVNQKELNVVFVKKLITDKNDIKYRDNTNGNQIEISEEYESLIPKCFDLISISSGSASTSSSINIDYTVPAKIQNITSQTNDSEFTVITLTLTQNISLNDLQNLYIRLKYADGYQELTQDPVTGINNSRVTFIQDELGNYMQMYSAHAISDFAINVVNPLYAYDSEMTYDSQSLMDGLYNEGSWAVHDWNADQQNYGSLPANHEYELIADIDDGTEDKTYLPSGVRAFFAINQTSNSVSSQYNSDLNTSLRVWLPALSNSVIAALSPVNNDLSNILTKDSVTLDSETPERINFTIGKDFSTTWGSGKQVSFLFGLLDTNNEIIRIYNAPYYDVTNNTYNLALSTAVPLFALRTKDSSVLSSLDLWSFKTHASVEQRGGVTILNNVIDLSNGEKTVLKVNNPSNGKVNIMVMTLDGNIITYLNRGNLTSGQHYFYWDGKNKKNNQVARGMYFIRIVGNGFDETRKVLVTK